MLGRGEGDRGRGEEGGDKGYLLSEGEKVSPLSTEEGLTGGKGPERTYRENYTEIEADSSLGLRRRRRAARLDIAPFIIVDNHVSTRLDSIIKYCYIYYIYILYFGNLF